jgi:hypothetical protein
MKQKLQLVAVATDKTGAVLVPKSPHRMEYKLGDAAIWKYSDRYTPHHLYLVSDEKIKEGDWIIVWNEQAKRYELQKVYKFTEHGYFYTSDTHPFRSNISNSKKIIATTNPDLWSHYDLKMASMMKQEGIIAKLPQSLTQEWVKRQGAMDSVIVDYEEITSKLKLTPSGEIIWSPVDESR